MSRYQNGLIYKLVSNNPDIKDTYVGSCCNLYKRKAEHKSNCYNKKNKNHNLRIYKFIRENGGWTNWSMIQIEPYPCNTKRELESRERHHLEQLNANLNCIIPTRTQKEYYEDNRDNLIAKMKQYNKDNNESILEYQKQYNQQKKEPRTCVCGGKYDYGRTSDRNKHFSSQKHNNYITALNEHLRNLMCQ